MPNDDRSASEIGQALDAVILEKARQPWLTLLLFGVLAGAYIGFGAIAATTVSAYEGLPVGLSRLLAGSVFCVGLILVIIPGSELFTGNVLMIAGVLGRRLTLWRVLRNWLIVYSGNFLGAVALAAAMLGSGLMGSPDDPLPVGERAAAIASAKIALPAGQALIRGVLCNMLVCLAILLALSSRTTTGKVLGIYFPIMVFVLSGFEHSIANMYFLPAGLMASGRFATWAGFASMFHNLLPVTVGNLIGGSLIIVLHPRRAGQILGRLFLRPHHPAGK
jgi:formate/nitrite transporter